VELSSAGREQAPAVVPIVVRLLSEDGPGERWASLCACPACARVSVNLVTHEHVDVRSTTIARSASSGIVFVRRRRHD